LSAEGATSGSASLIPAPFSAPKLPFGIDVGSTYTKALLLREGREALGTGIVKTGFRLSVVATLAYQQALAQAGIAAGEVAYVTSTGYGRYQVSFRDVQVTDLTAHVRGACFFFPRTRTVLDVGGQTMKVSCLDECGTVKSFHLNDKCAAGTGAFLGKTAGCAPADIMPGTVVSLFRPGISCSTPALLVRRFWPTGGCRSCGEKVACPQARGSRVSKESLYEMV